YDPQGNLTGVTRNLSGGAPLARNTSLGVAGPLDASGGGQPQIAAITYDPKGTGNPLTVQLYPSSTSNKEPPRCSEVKYDGAYSQFRTSEIAHIGDCSATQAIVT